MDIMWFSPAVRKRSPYITMTKLNVVLPGLWKHFILAQSGRQPLLHERRIVRRYYSKRFIQFGNVLRHEAPILLF